MSGSIIEQMRAAHETIELLDKAISQTLTKKTTAGGNQRKLVQCDNVINTLVAEMKDSATSALELYLVSYFHK